MASPSSGTRTPWRGAPTNSREVDVSSTAMPPAGETPLDGPDALLVERLKATEERLAGLTGPIDKRPDAPGTHAPKPRR